MTGFGGEERLMQTNVWTGEEGDNQSLKGVEISNKPLLRIGQKHTDNWKKGAKISNFSKTSFLDNPLLNWSSKFALKSVAWSEGQVFI